MLVINSHTVPAFVLVGGNVVAVITHYELIVHHNVETVDSILSLFSLNSPRRPKASGTVDAMYYPQQSPGIKLANHHDQSGWPRPHIPQLGPPGSQQSAGPPQPSPSYSLYTNGTMNPMQHHPHHPHPGMPLHHHQNSLSHYPSPPNGHSHQQQSFSQGSPASVGSQIISPHWQQQLLKCEMIRSSRAPHHRARASAMASRTVTKSAIPITNPNLVKLPPPETNGSAKESDSSDASDLSPAPSAALNHPSATVPPVSEAPRPTSIRPPENTWNSLDMGGVGVKNLPPTSGLFSFKFLINLYLNHNSLSYLPPEISKLRHLEVLDLSGNLITNITPSIGMLVSLKELYLFDNHVVTLPAEFGNLHQLQTLGIEGNPLDPQLKAIIQRDGTPALIVHLRDSSNPPAPPPERRVLPLIPPVEMDTLRADPNTEIVTVSCYNILCAKYATARLYGYTPSWALNWEYRRDLILTELMTRDTDFMCLQEVDTANYEDYLIPNLKGNDYAGVFYPKSRAKTMNESERRQVDGCAIFYKASKYNLVEQHLIEFSAMAMQRQDFKKTDDMFNRVLGKDHIAVVCLLENKETGTRFVLANAHISWDPKFCDVKLVQVGLLLDEVDKMAADFARYPPPAPPSPVNTRAGVANGADAGKEGADSEELNGQSQPQGLTRPPPIYTDGTKIPMIVCGDFNSVPNSALYNFLSNGTLPPDHADFLGHTYGSYTSEGLRHRLGLKSAYDAPGAGEPPVTNYTPSFQGAIDYIWYSTANLSVTSVLEGVDKKYLEKVVGFPNAHFPSDHVCLMSEFRVKPPRPPATS